jgi:hypothetical protein
MFSSFFSGGLKRKGITDAVARAGLNLQAVGQGLTRAEVDEVCDVAGTVSHV